MKKLLCLSVLFLCGCQDPFQEANNAAFESGRRAYKAGCTSESNPHIGENERRACSWLNGYIYEKEQDAKGK